MGYIHIWNVEMFVVGIADDGILNLMYKWDMCIYIYTVFCIPRIYVRTYTYVSTYVSTCVCISLCLEFGICLYDFIWVSAAIVIDMKEISALQFVIGSITLGIQWPSNMIIDCHGI